MRRLLDGRKDSHVRARGSSVYPAESRERVGDIFQGASTMHLRGSGPPGASHQDLRGRAARVSPDGKGPVGQVGLVRGRGSRRRRARGGRRSPASVAAVSRVRAPAHHRLSAGGARPCRAVRCRAQERPGPATGSRRPHGLRPATTRTILERRGALAGDVFPGRRLLDGPRRCPAGTPRGVSIRQDRRITWMSPI